MSQLALITNAVLAFDEPIYANGLKRIIKDWKGILKFAIVQSLIALNEKLKNVPSEQLIIDERFPGFSSPADIKNFTVKFNNVRILLFCHSKEKSTLRSLANANVSGLVSRKVDRQNAAHAIRMVMADKKFNNTDSSLNSFPKINAPHQPVQPADIYFCNREHDLISCLIKELKPAAIYKNRRITSGTYKQYRSQINKKIKLHGYTSIDQYIAELKKSENPY